jgi:hypothetical protein
MDGNSFYLLDEVITRIAAHMAIVIRASKDRKIKIEKTKAETEVERDKNDKPAKKPGLSSLEKLESAYLGSAKGITNSQLKEFMAGINNDMAKAILKMVGLGIPLVSAKTMVCGAAK